MYAEFYEIINSVLTIRPRMNWRMVSQYVRVSSIVRSCRNINDFRSSLQSGLVTHQELADLEVAPDTQLVTDIDLSNRHPFMVSTHTRHFSVCKASSRCRKSTPDRRVIAVCRTGLP